LLAQHPVQCVFEFAKDTDSSFPSSFAENSIHSSKTEPQVVGHEYGAARIQRENTMQGQLMQVGGGEIELCNVCEIQQL